MAVIINTRFGENKGRNRVWLEGRKLAHEGIEPGMKYRVLIDHSTRQAKVQIAPDLNDATGSISRRKVRGEEEKYLPVLDLAADVADELRALFEGASEIRVAVRGRSMTISAQLACSDAQERVERARRKMKNGEPFAVASFFHGGGVIDDALHSGLARAGVSSFVQVAVELEQKYLESSLNNNGHLFNQDTVFFEGSIEHFNPRGVKAEIVCAGIPCTGASLSGRAKNKLAFAEDHDTAGALFYYVLNAVTSMNPAVVLIENVEPYAHTASMSVIRAVLRARGYVLHERVLDGGDFGCLEARRRLCVVAMSEGLADTFSLDGLVSIKQKEACIGDILDPIPDDSEMFRSYSYLADKEVRDKAAGKGFARQLITEQDSSVGCLGKAYNKARSTEPFLVNKTNPDLSRLFTPQEHARLKGVPSRIIAGNSVTTAHEILGQSVCWPCFEAVGYAIGASMAQSVVSVPLAA